MLLEEKVYHSKLIINMADQDKKNTKPEVKKPDTKGTAENAPVRGDRRNMQTQKRRPDSRGRRGKKDNSDGVDKKIVSIRRVSRTYSGGKRMRLSVLVVAGDKNGRVGAALAKAADVRTAEDKAFSLAKKKMVKVSLRGGTIPHQVTYKKGAARIFMKPAAPGTGVIAGGAMRAVLELVGVKDILTKVIGSSNNISNVYAAIEALQSLKPVKRSNNVKESK